MSEMFSVGDMVIYNGPLARKALQCKIVRIMPVEHAHTVRSYRIRDSAEAFERAVPESTLTKMEASEAQLLFKS
jgi:hypothetical protein